MNKISIVNILEILNKYDVEGLIKIGAPADEYTSEARIIYNNLIRYVDKHSNISEDIITNLVTAVFMEWFGYEDESNFYYRMYNDYNIFKKIAKDIYNQFFKLIITETSYSELPEELNDNCDTGFKYAFKISGAYDIYATYNYLKSELQLYKNISGKYELIPYDKRNYLYSSV